LQLFCTGSRPAALQSGELEFRLGLKSPAEYWAPAEKLGQSVIQARTKGVDHYNPQDCYRKARPDSAYRVLMPEAVAIRS